MKRLFFVFIILIFTHVYAGDISKRYAEKESKKHSPSVEMPIIPISTENSLDSLYEQILNNISQDKRESAYAKISPEQAEVFRQWDRTYVFGLLLLPFLKKMPKDNNE